MIQNKPVIYTIGHSNYPIEKLLVWLNIYDVNRVIDVRTSPYSRFCPHFNKHTLVLHLNQFGIEYDFRGNSLGGKGENINYQENISDLFDISRKIKIALLCSEKDYKKCHRHTMLEPDLKKLGIEVAHINYEIVREHATDLHDSNQPLK